MRLLLIRHAIAEASEAFAASGRPDEERPLTDRGRRRMRANALGLSLLVPSLDLLVSSPYRRAADTAAIVAAALELPRDDAQLQHESLAHDRAPREFIEWLAQQTARLRSDTAAATLGAVGHEPQLGRLVAWCTAGSTRSFVDFKKGGACLIAFDAAPARAGGRLLWLLRPAQLRSLGKD